MTKSKLNSKNVWSIWFKWMSTRKNNSISHKNPKNSSLDTASENDYKENKHIFGDAIRETSTGGT